MQFGCNANRETSRSWKLAAAVGLVLVLVGLTGCFDLAYGYSDWGYGDYGYADYGGYGYGSGAGAAGYGFTEYDSYGNQGAGFSLAGDPGESLQNYLSSFVSY